MPGRVQQVVLVAGDVDLEVDRTADDLVRRGLVHAALFVVAGPDAGHVARGRHVGQQASGRVHRLHPRPVERRVHRVVARLVDPPLLDLLGVQPRRGVEDGDPVTHQLAVRDHLGLHRLHGVEVDRTLLVGAHQVRYAEHGDLVDGLQAGEPRALRDVTDVVVGTEPGRGQGGGRGGRVERGLAGRQPFDRPAAGLLQLDQLRGRVDHGDHVLLALGHAGPVELLGHLAVALDHDPEHVRARGCRRRDR